MFPYFYHTGTPRFPKSPSDQMIGYLGKETRLQCDAIGHPTPEVQWTRSPLTPFHRGAPKWRRTAFLLITLKVVTGACTYVLWRTNTEWSFMERFWKSSQLVSEMFRSIYQLVWMVVKCRKYSLESPNICFQVGKILACSFRTIFYAKQLGNRQLSNSYLLALAYQVGLAILQV